MLHLLRTQRPLLPVCMCATPISPAGLHLQLWPLPEGIRVYARL